jgi:hypothetical protein
LVLHIKNDTAYIFHVSLGRPAASNQKRLPRKLSPKVSLSDPYLCILSANSRTEQDGFQFPKQHFTIIHLFERHDRSKFLSLGRRWFHREKEATVARASASASATTYFCVFHLYMQSNDNRVALIMAHAEIFQSSRLNCRPCAYFHIQPCVHMGSTTVAPTTIVRVESA